jgi:hypothetical protein
MDPVSSVGIALSVISFIDYGLKAVWAETRKGQYGGSVKFRDLCERFLIRLERLLMTMKTGVDAGASFPPALLSEAQRIVTSYSDLAKEVLEARKGSPWMRAQMTRKMASSERRLSELINDLERLGTTLMVSLPIHSVNAIERTPDSATKVWNQLKRAEQAQLSYDEKPETQLLPVARVDSFPDSDSWATLSWLPDLNYQQKQREFRDARTPGSSHYVLGTRTFRAWLNSPVYSSGCVMWCNGRPGVGKTILS